MVSVRPVGGVIKPGRVPRQTCEWITYMDFMEFFDTVNTQRALETPGTLTHQTQAYLFRDPRKYATRLASQVCSADATAICAPQPAFPSGSSEKSSKHAKKNAAGFAPVGAGNVGVGKKKLDADEAEYDPQPMLLFVDVHEVSQESEQHRHHHHRKHKHKKQNGKPGDGDTSDAADKLGTESEVVVRPRTSDTDEVASVCSTQKSVDLGASLNKKLGLGSAINGLPSAELSKPHPQELVVGITATAAHRATVVLDGYNWRDHGHRPTLCAVGRLALALDCRRAERTPLFIDAHPGEAACVAVRLPLGKHVFRIRADAARGAALSLLGGEGVSIRVAPRKVLPSLSVVHIPNEAFFKVILGLLRLNVLDFEGSHEEQDEGEVRCSISCVLARLSLSGRFAFV